MRLTGTGSKADPLIRAGLDGPVTYPICCRHGYRASRQWRPKSQEPPRKEHLYSHMI